MRERESQKDRESERIREIKVKKKERNKVAWVKGKSDICTDHERERERTDRQADR